MVDTLSCLSVADLTEEFFEKLLLGAVDKAVDHQAIAAPRGAGIVANSHDTALPYSPQLRQGSQEESNHQQYVTRPERYRQSSLVERNSDSQVRTLYNLQAIPGSSPHLEQYNQQPIASLPRQSTLPQSSAELPHQPTSRSRIFGGAKEKAGFKPSS